MKKTIFLLLSISLFLPLISFSTTTYTVGAAGSFTTIANAYAACTGSTDYVIEIRSDYNYNSETTTGVNTISLGALSNKSNINTVTIRPASGVSVSLTGTASSIFTLDGANWIIFDGRAAGVGTSAWTIINSSSSASKRVLTFINDASNNVIKYCSIKGDNSSSSTNTAGLILFSTTTGSNGNDSNTIDNCTLRENSANPGCLIQSTGTAAKTNSSNTISNSNLINATSYSIWMDSNTDTWTVSGNSFYQTTAISPTTSFYMINISTGGGYSFTGNYFGGQAASCGGSAYTITTTSSQVGIIQFGSSCSGSNNIISSNTFSNFSITTTYTAGTKISMIICQGSSSFTIGSLGNANTIGSTSGTDNISITDNSASGVRTFVVFNLLSTGTSSTIAYNTVGSISVGGTNTTGTFILVRNIGSGATLSINNNTFGNSTANNMTITSDLIHEWITNNGGAGTYTLTTTNNTFQNFNITSTANRDFIGIDNTVDGCTLLATGNTFKNISSTIVGFYYFIAHGDWITTFSAGTTQSSNVFQDITISSTSSTRRQFILFANTSAATTISSNTIGSTTSNNMNFKANTYCYPIYKDGSGSLTSNTNTIQQFTLPNTSTSVIFTGINVENGTASINSNNIKNISTTSQSSFPIIGIDINSASNSHTIANNKLDNFSATTTANVTNYLQGITIGTSAGSGTISKNRMRSFTDTKTSISGDISGVYIYSTTSAWNCFNNVIILSNGANTNRIDVIGIGYTSSGTGKIIHNTISISGSTTSATSSYCMYDFSASGTTRTVYNNIFLNTRTGSGDNYSILLWELTGATYNYNYLQVSDDVNKLAYTQVAGDRTFAQWQTTSGYSNNKNSTISVNSTYGTVVTASTSDVQTTGTNDNYADVSSDFDGNTRANAGDGSPNGPWMGAFESIVTLPIELLFFNAKLENNTYVDLTWSTASEINNDYFTIERSQDGEYFQEFDIVAGAGNSTHKINYSLIDRNPFDGISYYRLKQTDYDGKYSYSDIISVNKTNLNSTFTIYPNPNHGNEFAISGNVNWENAKISIYNQSGMLIENVNINDDLLIHPSSNLNSGIYFIKIISNETNTNLKMIVN